MNTSLLASAAVLLLAPSTALAQDHSGHTAPAPAAKQVSDPNADHAPSPPPVDHDAMDHGSMNHGAMDHGNMDHGSMKRGDPDAAAALPSFNDGSGTARLPGNEPMNHGLHLNLGEASSLMLHGFAWGVYTDQGGPRGDSKAYVQSMEMAEYDTRFEGGRLRLRAMGSLEPAMRHDGYPNLFATGEVAYGEALVDRQHPHDLFMELSARLDVNIADDTTAFVYGGPVAEPALGPSAFMHRGSARYNPEAPITHHWFDSSHITYGVVTAGISAPLWQIEASAFRGREPDEFRWNIESPKLDSWSARFTLNPSPALALQASYGEIESPEELHPGEDERRTTLSAHYNNGAGLAATAAFSAKDRVPGETLTAWLGEVNWDLDAHHTLFGRIENVANDELFSDHAHPLHDQTFRISKFQAGYAYRLALGGPFRLALGGSLAAFAKPAVLEPYYGSNPLGYTLFARFSLGD